MAGNTLCLHPQKDRRHPVGQKVPGVLDRITLLDAAHQEVRRPDLVGIPRGADDLFSNLAIGAIPGHKIPQVVVEQVAPLLFR